MSKDLRLVRLFSYDQRSYSMFEKRFRSRCRGAVLDYFKRFFCEIVKGRRNYEHLLPLTIGLN